MDERFIIQLIGKIRDSTTRFLTEELKKHNLSGVSPSHGDILGALILKGKIRMKDLSTIINRDKSTITALVNKLEGLGYIIKESDPFDNRITMILLSKKGEGVKSDILDISEKLQSKAYKGFSAEEKKILNLLLKKIYKNFKVV